MITVLAGNIVRDTITFVPTSGTVSLANVTCRYITDYTTGDVSADIVSVSANVFRVDIAIPDIEPSGIWRLRWESNTPSAKIVVEDLTTSFRVTASAFAAP